MPRHETACTVDGLRSEMINVLSGALANLGSAAGIDARLGHAMMIVEALPLSTAEHLATSNRLSSVRRYAHYGEPGAAQYELQLLLRFACNSDESSKFTVQTTVVDWSVVVAIGYDFLSGRSGLVRFGLIAHEWRQWKFWLPIEAKLAKRPVRPGECSDLIPLPGNVGMAKSRSTNNNDNRIDTAACSTPGVVSVFELYTLREAQRRLGWTESAMRAARRRGLRLLRCGKRGYVTGRELLRFIESEASSSWRPSRTSLIAIAGDRDGQAFGPFRLPTMTSKVQKCLTLKYE